MADALFGADFDDREGLTTTPSGSKPFTILGMDIGLALGGAFFTETVFGLPGLGKLLVGSINSFDLATTEGVVVFATLCILVFNLVVDTLYAWVDPRIRLT